MPAPAPRLRVEPPPRLAAGPQGAGRRIERGESWAGAAAVLGLSLLGGGCSWTDRHGTHHLIVGFGLGVVTTTNRPGVDVYDGRVLGALAGPHGAGVGWMQQHRVQIDPLLASNVVVSIRANPGGLTVTHFDLVSTNLLGFPNPDQVQNLPPP